MSRLVNPGVGEVSDRLTILALKILTGREAGKDIAHFETERGALLTKIRSRTLNGTWFETVLDLAVVNGEIWHGEDDLRSLRAAPKLSQAELDATVLTAFRLQSLNDRRAELVAQINREAGDGESKEKG